MFDDTIPEHDVKAETAPDPAPEERAWADGYTAGVAGEKDGPVGLAGTVRAAWWAGFTAGFAHASERRAAAYRAAEFLPTDTVDWMAATWDVTSDPAGAGDDPGPRLGPEMRSALQISWERNEEAYRYLGR